MPLTLSPATIAAVLRRKELLARHLRPCFPVLAMVGQGAGVTAVSWLCREGIVWLAPIVTFHSSTFPPATN